MAILLKLQQVVEEEGGKFSVYVQAVREGNNELIKKKCFQVSDGAELKALVKPLFESLVNSEKQKDQKLVIAQGILDEIMEEVSQP